MITGESMNILSQRINLGRWPMEKLVWHNSFVPDFNPQVSIEWE